MTQILNSREPIPEKMFGLDAGSRTTIYITYIVGPAQLDTDAVLITF